MNICKDCIYLSSNVLDNYICKRPDGNGNFKAIPYAMACSEFKEKEK